MDGRQRQFVNTTQAVFVGTVLVEDTDMSRVTTGSIQESVEKQTNIK